MVTASGSIITVTINEYNDMVADSISGEEKPCHRSNGSAGPDYSRLLIVVVWRVEFSQDTTIMDMKRLNQEAGQTCTRVAVGRTEVLHYTPAQSALG
ncbi:MAG: hypothetical protein A3H97_01755 [Acidobacteria bacterium RIFCSPLOWO2_02_FULL_65_29]|nr:MAG: hypothetical protein A3H97_01755 [Acidobacteria bacterium RIFCSPLOWO2_02_FULL_65_29]